jgi:hypothetical protein
VGAGWLYVRVVNLPVVLACPLARRRMLRPLWRFCGGVGLFGTRWVVQEHNTGFGVVQENFIDCERLRRLFQYVLSDSKPSARGRL